MTGKGGKKLLENAESQEKNFLFQPFLPFFIFLPKTEKSAFGSRKENFFPHCEFVIDSSSKSAFLCIAFVPRFRSRGNFPPGAGGGRGNSSQTFKIQRKQWNK
ncbi:MAG: hypothetical protein J6Y32_03435 [Bacteroidales bacterium]|nr:hypothetical protein [Bacteroidales bacterium]